MSKLSIVSFNIRHVWKGDGINSFIHRAGFIDEKISEQKPDVIAFQEVRARNLEILRKLMPDYHFVGHLRNSDYKGEGLYTAVKMSSCEVIGFEAVWLSPTPYVAGSRFECQSECPRICLCTTVRHLETGMLFRVFNIHLDLPLEARVLGMKSALEFVSQQSAKSDLPYVILGDFNSTPDDAVIDVCNNCDGIKDITSHIPVTFQDFGRRELKLDYMYVTDSLAEKAVNVGVWDDEINGIYLSDHYPVFADFEI